MTWDTHIGPRVLTGAEAALYLQLLKEIVDESRDMSEMGDRLEVETGDRIFDNASFEQRVVLWHQCLKALLRPDVAPPNLTNVSEAAAYFPYAFLKERIAEEIEWQPLAGEDEDPFYYRRLAWNTLDALGMLQVIEADFEGEEDLLPIEMDSDDWFDWETNIDALADRIFWDRDWQMTSIAPQLLDGVEEQLAYHMGISEIYVQNGLPKVTEAEAKLSVKAILEWPD